jgi:hypothetical protein
VERPSLLDRTNYPADFPPQRGALKVANSANFLNNIAAHFADPNH